MRGADIAALLGVSSAGALGLNERRGSDGIVGALFIAGDVEEADRTIDPDSTG
jgi:hypothetical protein